MASVPTGHASEVLPQFPESKNPSHTNSREHNADASGSTLYNSRSTNPISRSEDVLCASCSEFYYKCSVPSYYRYIISETSTVGAALSNEKCPSCRLIAHCIDQIVSAQFGWLESQILLLSTPDYFDGRTGRQGRHIKKSLPRRVEIRLRMQKPPNEEEIHIDDRDVIGLLLPVTPDKLSDRIGLTGHKALFNTLEYQGSVYARPIAYTVDVKLLRTWMDFCATSHGSCKIAKTPNDANMRLRLIDVVERRLVDATLGEEYIALSYVWGPGNNKVLMKNTLNQLQEKGSLNPSAVPRLVADVMDFVAEIGERYLWIDTACIIQDDPLDKQRQLPNMSSIYTYAKLTIVAAVEGANDPLPRWNGCHNKIPVPTELIRGVAYTIGERPLLAALSYITWNRRGWTLQEALLARRLLIFTDDLIYWSCREESWCEDQYTEFHNVKNEPTPQSSLFAMNFRQSTCDGRSSVTSRLNAMELYTQHAQNYSRRSFSNYSDIVWAFSGILTAMEEHFPNGYIWAVPYDQVDVALLWWTCCERTECIVHQCDLNPESRLPIPSWCWIGQGHAIWFPDGIGKIKSRVIWHEPVKCWSSDIDTVVVDDQELVRRSQAAVGLQSTTEKILVFDYAFLHFTARVTMLCIELESGPGNLKILTPYIRNEQADPESHPLLTAKILLPSKRAIGQIRVPAYMFRNNTKLFGEFVLLSEYTGEIDGEAPKNNTGPIDERKSEEDSDNDRVEDDTKSPQPKEENACENENEEYQDREFDNAKKRTIPEGHKEDCSHWPALNIMLIEWDETHNIKNFARRVAITRIDSSAWEEVETTEKTIVLG